MTADRAEPAGGYEGDISAWVRQMGSRVLTEEVPRLTAAGSRSSPGADASATRPGPSSRQRDMAHGAVDKAADCVAGLMGFGRRVFDGAADLLRTVIAATYPSPPSAPPPAGLSVLTFGPMTPGKAARISSEVRNDTAQTLFDVVLTTTDLTTPTGQVLPASAVVFTPAELDLPPRSFQAVAIEITVPANAPAGSYAGFIQSGTWRLGVLSLDVR